MTESDYRMQTFHRPRGHRDASAANMRHSIEGQQAQQRTRPAELTDVQCLALLRAAMGISE